METYFSVGEISKLTNVPIQTLRYYDKMGLLKPAYINEQNNYRYYSVNQFIKIDLLKKQPEEQKKLQEVHTKLGNTLKKMVRVNESNKMLMKESMEILEFEMNLVKGLKMAPETNNYTKGAYSAGGTEYGAGAFDAKQ